MPEEPEPTPLPPVEDADDAYIEKRAEELGLPTDPEAYQDGGMAVVARASDVAEAELLAAVLKGEDIPAWVNAPLEAIYTGYIPAHVSVIVPMGRLADAQRVLSNRESLNIPAEPETPEPAALSWRVGTWVRLAISVYFLLTGLLVAYIMADNLRWAIYLRGMDATAVFKLMATLALSALFVVAGVWGIKSAWRRRYTK